MREYDGQHQHESQGWKAKLKKYKRDVMEEREGVIAGWELRGCLGTRKKAPKQETKEEDWVELRE